jgi:hypothetical protein
MTLSSHRNGYFVDMAPNALLLLLDAEVPIFLLNNDGNRIAHTDNTSNAPTCSTFPRAKKRPKDAINVAGLIGIRRSGRRKDCQTVRMCGGFGESFTLQAISLWQTIWNGLFLVRNRFFSRHD